MKSSIPFLFLAVALLGQDTPPEAKALISSDFTASIESLGTRIAQTDLTVVYLDTANDDQFVDVSTIRADVTQFIRDTGGTAVPEVYAKNIGRRLIEKYPQIAGLSITIYTNITSQGSAGYTTSLTRLAPDLTPPTKTAVVQKLSEARKVR